MTRSISPRVLAVLLLGAAISSSVLAAPTMNSSPFLSGARGLQSRSSVPEQGSLSDFQRRGVEHVNLVPRTQENAGEHGSTNSRPQQDEKDRSEASHNSNLNGPASSSSSRSNAQPSAGTTATAAHDCLQETIGGEDWATMPDASKQLLISKLREGKASLDAFQARLHAAPRNSRQSLIDQHQNLFDDIIATSQMAVALLVPVGFEDEWKLIMENYDESMQFIPDSKKMVAMSRMRDCVLRVQRWHTVSLERPTGQGQ
ncbi:hypothetical protein FB446DRAFT_792539 [Lentinula raphanica]|nr:hypothetical protein FB446DRAFT_792539 [Lentinula raphanica]